MKRGRVSRPTSWENETEVTMSETIKIDKDNFAAYIMSLKGPKKPKKIKRDPVYLNMTWSELFDNGG